MKRKLLMLAVFTLAVSTIFSCSESVTELEESYFSEAQKKTLSLLNGSFSYTLSIDTWSNTTTITFLEQYNPPKKGTLDDGTEISVHGKYRIIYDGGQTYEQYYNLSNSADRLYSYFSLTGINSIEKKDFRIVDDNTFQIKELNGMLWDTYNRTN